MNNRQFQAQLARRSGLTEAEVASLNEALIRTLTDTLQEDGNISIKGFGTFELKKKAERMTVLPNKKRMLFPPKLQMAFKPATALKDKANQTS